MGDAFPPPAEAGRGGMMGPHPGGLSTSEGKRLARAVACLTDRGGPAALRSACCSILDARNSERHEGACGC